MWDLSSPTRNRTHTHTPRPQLEAWSLNHWATRDVPGAFFYLRKCPWQKAPAQESPRPPWAWAPTLYPHSISDDVTTLTGVLWVPSSLPTPLSSPQVKDWSVFSPALSQELWGMYKGGDQNMFTWEERGAGPWDSRSIPIGPVWWARVKPNPDPLTPCDPGQVTLPLWASIASLQVCEPLYRTRTLLHNDLHSQLNITSSLCANSKCPDNSDLISSSWYCIVNLVMLLEPPNTRHWQPRGTKIAPSLVAPRLVGWADDDQADHGMNAVGQRAANAKNEIKWDKGLEGYGGEREERRWNRGRNPVRRSSVSSWSRVKTVQAKGWQRLCSGGCWSLQASLVHVPRAPGVRPFTASGREWSATERGMGF